jgi:ABC-type multidrug transport system ATPase subunit
MTDTLADDAPAVIAVEHLHKAYGATVAVDDVSFSVRAGEIFGVLGRTGAGKTTTVECLSGLRVPDGGRLEVRGVLSDLAEALAGQQATLAANAGSREDNELL